MTSTAHAEGGPHGLLPVDKPAGPTSHDIVALARRALGTRRIGHTGTLDPFASGLLLLCAGNATRIAEYLTGMDKRYLATVRLGVATDTDDHTGAVIAESDAAGITADEVEQALQPLRGAVLQVPPRYSAKKREGERAYSAARAGRPVLLDPVQVRVHELVLLSFEPPLARVEVLCSSGTYIRAIARDLGEALGVGGHLTALRRTAVGPHTLDRAISTADLAEPETARAALVPIGEALPHVPVVQLDAGQAAAVRHGRRVRVDGAAEGMVLMQSAGDEAVGIGHVDGGVLQPRKVFA
jgi:tRNA pseudouridine55 synthase